MNDGRYITFIKIEMFGAEFSVWQASFMFTDSLMYQKVARE